MNIRKQLKKENQRETRVMPLVIYTGKSSRVIPMPYLYYYKDARAIRIRNFDTQPYTREKVND